MLYWLKRLGPMAVVYLAVWQPARAEKLAFSGPATRFAADELGGVREILRIEAIRPDRREIDYLLLGAPADATSGNVPERIQVVGPHGAEALLADIDGADCAFQRFAVVRSGGKVVLITAERVGSPDAPGGLSAPAPVDVQVYRRQDGGDPGDSSPIFVASGAIRHAGPLCSATDMDRAVDSAAATLLDDKGQPK